MALIFSTLEGLSLKTRIVGGLPVFCSPRWLTGVDNLRQDPAIEDSAEFCNEEWEFVRQSRLSVKSSILKKYDEKFNDLELFLHIIRRTC